MEQIDDYSFQCGVIENANAMVAAGIKTLALSRPAKDAGQRDALEAFVQENCRQHNTRYYREENLLVTDLLPERWSADKLVFLLYREDHVIEQYLRLKERKKALEAGGAYFGGNRIQLATELGRLLSYSRETIQLLLERHKQESA